MNKPTPPPSGPPADRRVAAGIRRPAPYERELAMLGHLLTDPTCPA